MNSIFDFIGILYSIIVELYVIHKLCRKEIKVNVISILLCIVIIIIYYYNGMYNYTFTKSLIFILLYFLLNYIFYNNTYIETFIMTIFYYILGGIFELFFSIMFFSLVTNIMMFDSNHLLKLLFTILIGLFLILIFKINKIRNSILKVYKSLNLIGNKILIISIIFIFLIINILIYSNANNISPDNYFLNIFIMIVLLIFEIGLINQFFKIIFIEKNNEILLNFMIKYENIIESDKLNRHEMLNNLIILKNIEDKNSKYFDEVLDSLIKKYDNNSLKYLNNISLLPNGIKGVIYYKFYEMKEQGLNVNLNISSESKEVLKNINSNLYFSVSKIIGILLDNAKESSIKSKAKEVYIDIYVKQNKLIIEVVNSIYEKVDINKILEKNYSTKGSNRGLGLYIVNKIVKNNKNINIDFEIINKVFISKIIIDDYK